MNKLSKIFLAIIVILIVIIIISLNRWLFFKDAYVSAVTENMRLIQRAEEIEKVYDRNMDNVKIEITQASSTGATIIITDNNKVPYIWKEDYKIEQKENDKWEEVKATSDITFSDEVYERDNNNQIKQEINWSNTYGTLQTGGHRQLFDLLNPTYRYYGERVIRKLLEHTARHPAVIGFQIDNETKHYGNEGEEMQRLFREYLKEKYKDTEAFNKAFYLAHWSNSIHSWEDLPDMRGCINGGLAGEFEAFKRSIAAGFLSWQAEIVKEYKREDQFITNNLDFEWKKFGADIAQDGYSYGVQPDLNHYEASQCLDLSGTDIYHPTQDELTGAETAFGGDGIRSLKNDNYLVLECQAQAFKYWTPYPGQLRLHAYGHLASGALGIMYWNWHSIHNGYETYWRGLLSHDLKSNQTYEEACVIGKEWKTYGPHLTGMKKKNRIALLVDNRSLTALQWFPIDKDLSYNDVVRWMYDSLYEMNLECDVVDVNGLEEGRYDMIVTPALYCAREDLIRRLKTFAEKGGVLVSSFRSFVADEASSVYPDELPHLLTDCFGMAYNQFTEPGTASVRGEKIQYFMELLKPAQAEEIAGYEHRYWGKYAGITKNRYGKGSAYYVGCYMDKKLLKDIYRQAAEDAHISLSPYSWPVIIRSGETEEGKILHYLLHYSQESRDILCPYDKAQDILTGKLYHKQDLIHLRDWDVVILEEQS